MQFNTIAFGVFCLGLFLLIAISRQQTYRKWLLLLASYAFYMYALPVLGLLLLGLSAVSYACGKQLARQSPPALRRAWLVLSICLCLAPLLLFKYAGFITGNANAVLQWLHTGLTLPYTHLLLPIGISFYSFRVLSYLLDIYWHRALPEHSALDYAIYVAFFPQLVAGPIVRAREFLPQLQRGVTVQYSPQIVLLICGGLIKKVAIADNLAPVANAVFSDVHAASSLAIWLGVLAFSVQIYCDFSGYSDIAIGITRLLGFEIGVNFDWPYLARNPARFWQKWHISLSNWIRDYIYLPMGGMHKYKRWPAIMLAMLLAGLWHGAMWTFVAWGGIQGLLLLGYRLYGEWLHHRLRWRRYLSAGVLKLLAWAVFQYLILISWIVFRAGSLPDAWHAIAKFCVPDMQRDLGALAQLPLATLGVLFVLFWLAHLVLSLSIVRGWLARCTTSQAYAAVALTTSALIILWPASSPPFIYSQF